MNNLLAGDSLRDCAGRPVIDLVPRLLEYNPQIQAMYFVAYRPAPNLGERIREKGEQLKEVSERASFIHEQYGVGFWDAVLGIALQRDELGEKFVELALTHDAAPDEKEYRFTREAIQSGELHTLLASPPENYGISISSKVEILDGREAHLPMLDFRCPHSTNSIRTLREALRELKQRRGVLVRSPKSYHYYGLDLVDRDGLIQFLAGALLLAPVVDARYIAHRILDGACRLRLIAVQGKGEAPVIEEFTGEW